MSVSRPRRYYYESIEEAPNEAEISNEVVDAIKFVSIPLPGVIMTKLLTRPTNLFYIVFPSNVNPRMLLNFELPFTTVASLRVFRNYDDVLMSYKCRSRLVE